MRLDDAIRLQADFMRKLDNVRAPDLKKTPEFVELVPADRKQAVATIEEQLKATKAAREQALKYYDEEIARQENAIKALRKLPDKIGKPSRKVQVEEKSDEPDSKQKEQDTGFFRRKRKDEK